MMNRISERKIVLVKRKTRLDELIARFNSISQAKFYVEHLGADFSDYEQEHEEYVIAIKQATDILGKIGRTHVLERVFLTNFLFGPDDIVVAIGQDGMVANTLKYLSGQPLLGVNPSPKRWDGVLLPFLVKDLSTVTSEVISGIRKHKEVTMATVKLNDGQTLLAVNDFFIGQKTHVSARYQISIADKTERQSSSGVIVSTGLGSTGWFKSVLEGANGVVSKISGGTREIESNNQFSWDSDYLYYSVREPFPSNTTNTELIFGMITNGTPLKIVSQMSENGVIFSDGIENDFLEFNSGMEATIGIAEKKGVLVV
jgi:NAD kinase